MRKLKFLLAFLFILFISVSFNKASAATIRTKNIAESVNSALSNLQKVNNKQAPFIQIIWFYTTCPNGVRRAVGCIGLTDNGTFIDYYYWGEAIACENDQVLIWA